MADWPIGLAGAPVVEWRAMELRRVCDIELAALGEAAGAGTLGAGGGVVRGELLSGALEWSNTLRRRSDGAVEPTGHATIVTGDGARIALALKTLWLPRVHGGATTRLLTVSFETDDERYRWLNRVHGMAEGAERKADGSSLVRVLAVANELPAVQ